MIRLGLIGANIKASRSPALQRHCGALHGVEVSYDLMIPKELGLTFDETFDRCVAEMAGFNVTLPFKEQVVSRLRVPDPVIARIGAVNTVKVTPEGPEGHNTDYTGFMAAFVEAFDHGPGIVALIGSGGVGKAVAFGLVTLGAEEIRVVDMDGAKAEALAEALRAAGAPKVVAGTEAATAMIGADGVINCTPLGMDGYPGSPVRDVDFQGTTWAFDAVYTPEHTLFRAQALAVGARFLSGWELFFNQGIHGFEIFTGIRPSRLADLRKYLREGAA